MPLRFIILYVVFAFTFVAGVIRYCRLNFPDRIIFWLVVLSILTEMLAIVWVEIWNNNLIIYHIFSPFELIMISVYFDRTVVALRRSKIALIIAALAIPLAILNAHYLQDPAKISNSYYVLLEGTLIIIFALLSFFQLLMEEERLPHHSAQFWISSSLIVFWSITYMGWGIYSVIAQKDFPLFGFFAELITIACYLQYLGFTYTFIQYKKLVPSGE